MAGAYSGSYIASNPCVMADIPVWVYQKWNAIKPKIESCSNYIHEFKLTIYQNNCGHGCWDTHWSKPEVRKWLIDQYKN